MSTAIKKTSANAFNRCVLGRRCVLNDTLPRVARRWKMMVLFAIHSGHRNFAALKKELPAVSDHVLAHRLRELVAEGLVLRCESRVEGGPDPL